MSSLDAFVRKSAWFSFIIVVNVDIVVIWKKNKEKIQNWNLTTFYLYILLFLQWKLTFDQQLSLPSETINHTNAGRVVSDGGVSYIARWDAWKYFFTIFFPYNFSAAEGALSLISCYLQNMFSVPKGWERNPQTNK